jgi:energy-coupling factor transport system permease protein
MQFYDFIYRNSVIHKLDPRTKILWVVALTFMVFMVKSNFIIISLFILTLLMVLVAKLPIKAVWFSSRLFVIGFTIGYIILFSLLLWNLKEGILGGLMFSIKFLVIIFSTIVFAMSTSPRDLISSLTKLKIPFEIAFMLTLAIRFVPVITREFNQVIDAQKARAHKIKFSLLHPVESAKTFIPILIPTLMLLFKKSLDLSMSIESRAFRAKDKRTYSPKLRFHSRDYVSVLILALLIFVLIRFN